MEVDQSSPVVYNGGTIKKLTVSEGWGWGWGYGNEAEPYGGIR